MSPLPAGLVAACPVLAALLAAAAVAAGLPGDPARRLHRLRTRAAQACGRAQRVGFERVGFERVGFERVGFERGGFERGGFERGAPRWLRPVRWRPGGGPAGPTGPGAAVPVPVVADLVAAALLTGVPPAIALGVVADALAAAADPGADDLRGTTGDHAGLREALDLAAATGLGPVPLVQAAADRARRRRAATGRVAARRLGTLVVLPTGLCLLPAFVLLTVAPLVLELLG